MQVFRTFAPGVFLCSVIAITATFVSEHYGGPQFLYALLIGMSFHFLAQVDHYQPGIELAAKKMIRIGVALLGARIVANDVYDLGQVGIIALIGAVVLTILFGMLLSRLLGLPSTLGLLSGGGSGICGISATLAIAAVLPPHPENERYTLLTAIGIAILSTVAMVLYPLLVKWSGMSVSEAGLFLGGSIHDVAQVVGAGLIISPEVGKAATLAKMFRVAMLMPVVVFLALFFQRRSQEKIKKPRNIPTLPAFLLVFAALALINSLYGLPPMLVEYSSDLSRWCLVISVAALGVKTSVEKMLELGWRPLTLFVGEAIFIAAYMLLVVLS